MIRVAHALLIISYLFLLWSAVVAILCACVDKKKVSAAKAVTADGAPRTRVLQVRLTSHVLSAMTWRRLLPRGGERVAE